MESITQDIKKFKSVRLYPELSLTALQRKWDKELALWYELRALNITGSGSIPLGKVKNLLVPRVYSEKTLRRFLFRGEGYFWQIDDTSRGKRILIFSPFEVARFFKVRHLSRPVEIDPLEFIFTSRQGKRAFLYISFFPPGNSKKNLKPLSRQTIEKSTGIYKKKQRRYERIIGIKKIPNFAYRQDIRGRASPLIDIVEGKNQLYAVRKRLGNSYQTPTLGVSFASVKKINKRLNGGFTKAVKHAKRYFFLGKGIGKELSRRDRSQESFLWIGKGEWCLVE